jgi:hypothetical protein
VVHVMPIQHCPLLPRLYSSVPGLGFEPVPGYFSASISESKVD